MYTEKGVVYTYMNMQACGCVHWGKEASAFFRATERKACPLQHECLFSRSAEMRPERDFRTQADLSQDERLAHLTFSALSAHLCRPALLSPQWCTHSQSHTRGQGCQGEACWLKITSSSASCLPLSSRLGHSHLSSPPTFNLTCRWGRDNTTELA